MTSWDELAGRLGSLALPIAQVARRAINAKSAADRHNLAYFAGEAMLKLSAAARVGVLLDRCLVPGSPMARQLECLMLPSAGQWLGLLRDVAGFLATRPDARLLPLAELGESLTARRPGWSATERP